MTDGTVSFTFAHFLKPELLEEMQARVRTDTGRAYDDEDLAAVSLYLAVLSLASPGQTLLNYYEEHAALHVLTNALGGGLTTDLITSGAIAPDKLRSFVLNEYSSVLGLHMDDGVDPMDKETFDRLWGGN